MYLGISRENTFSPNRVGGDKAIFDSVARELGCDSNMVFKMPEDEFARDGAGDVSMYDAVFHMCRSDRALTRLIEIEKVGIPVVNRPDAVINCRRINEIRLLQNSAVSFVRSEIVNTGEFPENWSLFPCWVKRGDSHSIQQDDVCYVEDPEALHRILDRMAERGFGEVVLQEHVQGHICKFYGIGNGLLFKHRFLENVGEGKFGLEFYNERGLTDVDEEKFRTDVSSIAEILGIDIYGGDAVVDHNGHAVIVDFNDWPSFFICRTEAAAVISELIGQRKE